MVPLMIGLGEKLEFCLNSKHADQNLTQSVLKFTTKKLKKKL